MKRILACDGGGIGAVLSLQVLRQIETIYRAERRNPELVLRDEFDFFAGTSTGAILATGLAWGMSVDSLEALYEERAGEIFRRVAWYKLHKSWYGTDALSDLFRMHFHEDDDAQTPALVGTRKLIVGGSLKYLLIVVRNASTGSPWPVTNNPRAKFNRADLPDCNLRIPLWQLLRASTAAPTYFPPELIDLGGTRQTFVDGGITPYNNPALVAALTATLPQYEIGWATGRDRLLLVSIGTGLTRVRYDAEDPSDLTVLDHLKHVPSALLAATVQEQDMICRILGECRFGSPLDLEIGDLRGPSLLAAAEKKFSYVRYNRVFDSADADAIVHRTGQKFTLDNVKLIPYLRDVGREYAERVVRREHLLEAEVGGA